jgi:DNA polymerase III subunit alpha
LGCNALLASKTSSAETIEIQDHGIPEQLQTNPQLIEIAKKIQAPLLATNDSHYTHRDDAMAHDALLCVQTGSQMDDPKRFKFHGNEHYLKSAAEMRHLFRHWESSCDNTLWIAERCQVDIEFGRTELPDFPLPNGFTTQGEYLRHLVYEGATLRWGTTLSDIQIERLEYELRVIEDMGFSAYFLIVWDLIKFAKDNAIRVGPGRGSAAGSAVSYCLRIVDLDPIKYDLLFERFLNPGRKQMPDIDMDFDERYRAEMIKYAARRYGWDHVAQIVTFSTIKARAAVRDAARVLGYPYSVGDKVAKAMPPLVMGRDTPLYACLEPHPKFEDGYKMAADLRNMYVTDPDVKRVVDVAKGLEGLRRQDGIHAAAVVITKQPLTEYLPIQRKPSPGGNPEDAPIVTQYEMHGVEELGLLKMDFLGLRNLSVIDRALDLIEMSNGVRVDIDTVDLTNEKTYEMLRAGNSIGVFQLEGGPMRSLMRSLEPNCFDDIAALVALYRPGPMAANMHNDYADRKTKRKVIEYFHPDAEELLADTQGLMIYQESMMRVAQKFAGYSLEQADNLRKAAGKKIREVMAKERQKFVDGCEATGYGSALGTKIFDIIEPFADYAFNKSHSFGYGFVSYQTAWLKANYPAEYLAALLTSVKDDKDKTAVYLSECRTMGLSVLVPDVNKSISDFSVDGNTIRFGLSAVRNVGEGLVALIVGERDGKTDPDSQEFVPGNGPYADFHEFVKRVPIPVLNKRSIESLIKGGAFDSSGHSRRGLMDVYEGIIDRVVARRKEEEIGVMSLFGEPEAGASGTEFDDARLEIPSHTWEKMMQLGFEKEMLGLYVSDHPLLGAQAVLRRYTDISISDLKEQTAEAAPVSWNDRNADLKTVVGIITGLQRKYTKAGDLMGVFTLEDLEAGIEVMVFPKTMLECNPVLSEDALVAVKGRLDTRDDIPKLIAMSVARLEISLDGGGPPLRLQLPATVDEGRVADLKTVLLAYPGDSDVFVHFGRHVMRLPPMFRVTHAKELAAEILVLFGSDAIIG